MSDTNHQPSSARHRADAVVTSWRSGDMETYDELLNAIAIQIAEAEADAYERGYALGCRHGNPAIIYESASNNRS